MLEAMLPSTDLFLRLAIGFAGAAAAAFLAFRLRSLSVTGAIAALVVGTLAAGAGWSFVILLLGFFVSSTSLSKFRRETKERIFSGIVAKGNERDAVQVISNGGVFALASLWYIVSPGYAAMLAAAGSVAAAAADTWATEVGSLSHSQPRSIVTWKRVTAGTSGGVTLLGASAGIAAGMFVAMLAYLTGMDGVFLACSTAGIAGMLADSFLGATVQSRRWCELCGMFTERVTHACGELTQHATGIRWINNDAVNLLSTLIGASVAALWVL